MKHILMIFLDGIGLGDDDPAVNPFAAAALPTLTALADGHKWLRATGWQQSARAILVPTDPRMGVPGRPQSGTGHATILTGRNIPALIGEHYGPKPNAATRALIAEDNFFKQVVGRGMTAALINAYPPRLLAGINRGKLLRSGIQQAVHEAGLPMFEVDKLYSRDALSEDWTGAAWRDHLGYADAPQYTPHDAGQQMVELSRRYDFAFFSHWMTDTVGHRGTVPDGVRLLELFDAVMAGALETWDDAEGLIVITSDHGNMEDLSQTHHTENDVATVIIGEAKARFADGLHTLADLVPRMADFLFAQ